MTYSKSLAKTYRTLAMLMLFSICFFISEDILFADNNEDAGLEMEGQHFDWDSDDAPILAENFYIEPSVIYISLLPEILAHTADNVIYCHIDKPPVN